MKYTRSFALVVLAGTFLVGLASAQSTSRWTTKAGVAKYGFEGGINFQSQNTTGRGFILELDYRLSSAPGRLNAALVASGTSSDELQPGITVLGTEIVGSLFSAPSEGLGVNPFLFPRRGGYPIPR